MLEVRTLGGLKLSVNGNELRIPGSHKAEAILVYLALMPGVQNRKVLTALLWPDSSESQAMASLRVALSHLRKDLDEYLEISYDKVGIRPNAKLYFDVTDLEMKLDSGQLEHALEIYHGDFLQGFFVRGCLDFEDWRRLQQERVHSLITSALQTAISITLAEADYEKGQRLAKRLLELDPLDELTHRKFMLLLALDGQRGRALQQYVHCREILQTELGAEPGQETQTLYTQILNNTKPGYDTSLLPPVFLPIPETSFIGREPELLQIAAYIKDSSCRLLSLIGPGGIGKTRLALRVITQSYPSFSDGSYFIPLEGVSSPSYLVHTIANAIHFTIDTVATQLDAKYQLLDYLKNRSMLLVLDSFEHLVTDAGLLSEIIGNAVRIKILVTSRQRLDIKSEWVFPVTGLPVPQGIEEKEPNQSSALALFVERARQANVKFVLSDSDQKHAIHICRLVDGMPLGIELAAAWTAVLSLTEITDEIQKSIDFLSSSMHDEDVKHRSLRAAIDGSWILLDQKLQDYFCKLSVFHGGFDRDAATSIAGTSLSQLSSLMDRSLVTRNNFGRFNMHALICKYAGEKLNASLPTSDEVHQQHCHYYTEFLIKRESDLNGPSIDTARVELRQEIENIRAAVDWAVIHNDIEMVRKILNSMLDYYVVQGWHEGCDTFRDIAQVRKEALISHNNQGWANDPIYLCALSHQAFLLCNLGRSDESDVISQACLEPLRNLGNKQELSECVHNLGVSASYRGDYQIAMEYLEQAILLGRDSENIIWYTYLLWLGHTYFLLGEYDYGMESLQKCYALYDKKGILWGKAFALSKMGLAATGLGKFLQANQYHQQALAIFEKNGNQAGKAYALSRMSMSAYFLEEYPQAVQLAQAGYQIFQMLGHHWGICTSLCVSGFGYIGLGEISRAGDCFRIALEQSRKYEMTPLGLYALAGLAAVFIHEKGEERFALELLHYVQNHPQTPAIYIEQTIRWFKPEHRILQDQGEPIISLDDEIEVVRGAIKRVLDDSESLLSPSR